MSSRQSVIQTILELYPAPSYLEIGVNEGETFSAISARRKVGVDPKFLFKTANVETPVQRTDYFEMTSDSYFAQARSAAEKFDVIFIDGLHTFNQTLRDLMNALACLKPFGTMIVDDVIPNSYYAGIADLKEFALFKNILSEANPDILADGSWMGDVYKIPFFIESFMQQFSYATVIENHGQLIMWHQPRSADAVGRRDLESITRLEYKHVIIHRETFNLKPLTEIRDLVKNSMY